MPDTSPPNDTSAPADRRPPHVKPPANLSKSPPVPVAGKPIPEEETLSPTRYGDWEHKGIAIDF